MKKSGYIILTLLFIFGCRTNSENPLPSQSSDYFPLHVGDTWRYLQSFNNDTLDYLDVQVEGIKSFNGINYYQLSYKYEFKKIMIQDKYFRKDNGKVFIYRDSTEKLYIDFFNRDTTAGYIYQKLDSLQTSIGLLRNIVSVAYPGSAVDAQPYEKYAQAVGLITSETEGPFLSIIHAKINGIIYQE